MKGCHMSMKWCSEGGLGWALCSQASCVLMEVAGVAVEMPSAPAGTPCQKHSSKTSIQLICMYMQLLAASHLLYICCKICLMQQ